MRSLIYNAIQYDGVIDGLYVDDKNGMNFDNNPTIAIYKGRRIINIRKNPYFFKNISYKDQVRLIYYKYPLYSYNIIKYIDSEQYKILDYGAGPNMIMDRYTGMEDMRLVVWDDILYGMLSRPDIISNKVIMQLVQFNDNFDIIRSWCFETPNIFEKNWLPIEDNPFTFMYDPAGSKTIYLNPDLYRQADDIASPSIINQIEPPVFSGKLSGSSQVIRYEDGYLCICHKRTDMSDSSETRHTSYQHYFVRYDNDMNIVSISQPFVFLDQTIEYCCGMVRDDKDIYITFSLYDGYAGLITIPIDRFSELLQKCISGDLYDYNEDDRKSIISRLISKGGYAGKYLLAMNYIDDEMIPSKEGCAGKYLLAINHIDERMLYNIFKEHMNDGYVMKPVIAHHMINAKKDTPLLRELMTKLMKG